MYRKSMTRRIVSIALTAVLFTATLFEGKVNVVAAESREQVSSTTGEAIATTETKSISTGDVSGGDISDGDTEKEDEKNISGESVSSGISRGCAWTIDAEGNLVVRDSDGTYGTDDWGWLDYKDEIKTADVDITELNVPSRMFAGCTYLKKAKIKIGKSGENASEMFLDCIYLENLDLKEFKTNNVKNMKKCFMIAVA